MSPVDQTLVDISGEWTYRKVVTPNSQVGPQMPPASLNVRLVAGTPAGGIP